MKILKSIAIMMFGALLVGSCTPNDEGNGKEGLWLEASKVKVYANGEDFVQLTLTLDGKVLTEGFELYDAQSFELVNLPNMRFTTTEVGTYTFKAGYGAMTSNTVSINALPEPPAAPSVPEDANPEKTNFYRRVLLTQFAGTGCGYCPYMINALHQVRADEVLDRKIAFTVAHLFNSNDPAYLSTAQTLDNSVGINGSAPHLRADLIKITAEKDEVPSDYSAIAEFIDKNYNRTTAKAGIAVNSKLYKAEKFVVLTALVKVNTTNEYRVGAWLLEDDILAEQNNYGAQPLPGVNFNRHEHAVRIADSRQSSLDYTGHALGTIEAGQTKSISFEMPLNNSWNADNLHLVLFVSTKEGDEWKVNNAIYAPVDGVTDFVYAD